jgi:polyhydroxybutyrate depolymerase
MVICSKIYSIQIQKTMYKQILAVCLLFTGIHAVSAQKCNEHIDSMGSTTYYYHLPKNYNKAIKYPLVVNFHGLGSQAFKHEQYCQLDKVADKEGFITVYPQSSHQGWNAGLGFRSYTNGPDDIGYFNKLLDTLEARYSIDKNRIYVTGVSIGGTFAYRVACEMSNRITAVASVSGLMTDSTLIYCNPVRNVPILHIHGTRDHIMRYTGMKQAFGAEEVIKVWELKNQCSYDADTIQIPNRNKSDHTTAILIKYKHCAGGSQVWFFKIKNGGHTWPGAADQFKLMGRKCKDFDGSQAIWDFFKQFTLEGSTSMVQK